ncbi:YciI family protein [Patulibacter defluvii]|uniref:YciI family protein n=1 Tax=Patulibacter defluvii TaxID=3095358 RepID=UPI002A759B8A|nr:YciI family protein [Patulibacter sp. DM4]
MSSDAGEQFLVLYRYVEQIETLRGPHRPAHLEHLRGLAERGLLRLAGATGNPPTGAAIVLRVRDREAAEALIAEDPYVRAGLVPEWSVEPWNVVVDADAGAPSA